MLKSLILASSLFSFVPALAASSGPTGSLVPAGLSHFEGCWEEVERLRDPNGAVSAEINSTFRFVIEGDAFRYYGVSRQQGMETRFDGRFTYRADGLMDLLLKSGPSVVDVKGIPPLISVKPNGRGRPTLEALNERPDLGKGMEYRTVDADRRLSLYAVFHGEDDRLTGTLEGIGQPISCDLVEVPKE